MNALIYLFIHWNLKDLNNELIGVECQALASLYKDDLFADKLVSKLSKIRYDCHSHADSEIETLGAAERYLLLKADGIQSVFPNIEVALRIYLSLMVSNSTALERYHPHA